MVLSLLLLVVLLQLLILHLQNILKNLNDLLIPNFVLKDLEDLLEVVRVSLV